MTKRKLRCSPVLQSPCFLGKMPSSKLRKSRLPHMFKSPVLVGDSAIPPNREVSSHTLRGDPVPASTTGSERRSRRRRNSELEEDLLRRIKMIFREGECRRWTAGNQAAGSQRNRQRRSFAPEYCYSVNNVIFIIQPARERRGPESPAR